MGVYRNGVKQGLPYRNGVRMNAYRNGVKMFNDGPLEEFEMMVNSGSDSQFILPLRYGAGTALHALRIDWGDGNVQTTTGTAGITAQYQGLTHAYPEANTDYTIKISGSTYVTTAENSSYFGLGFYSGSSGYNAAANKAKLKKLSGTPDVLMSSSIPSKNHCYHSMFLSCAGLTAIPENLLPATTLTSSCYHSMFDGCAGLTAIPENLLPVATLTNACYQSMFHSCKKITTIPANLLPATTLASSCYQSMFLSCTGLTAIPANLLPATTLASSCYNSMFRGCTKITAIPATLLPAATLTNACYQSMFLGCAGLTFIYMNAAWFSGKPAQSNMFYNCTKITANTSFANIPSEWKDIIEE
jgi:hypothetical protein